MGDAKQSRWAAARWCQWQLHVYGLPARLGAACAAARRLPLCLALRVELVAGLCPAPPSACQVDKILLEVAGETLEQMAAAPRQQKQVRCGACVWGAPHARAPGGLSAARALRAHRAGAGGGVLQHGPAHLASPTLAACRRRSSRCCRRKRRKTCRRGWRRSRADDPAADPAGCTRRRCAFFPACSRVLLPLLLPAANCCPPVTTMYHHLHLVCPATGTASMSNPLCLLSMRRVDSMRRLQAPWAGGGRRLQPGHELKKHSVRLEGGFDWGGRLGPEQDEGDEV